MRNIEKGITMMVKWFLMSLAVFTVFNANASLVSLSFEFDSVRHSVSKYDEITNTIYGDSFTELESVGYLNLIFNTESSKTDFQLSSDENSDRSQLSRSVFFFNDDNLLTIESEWGDYFNSFKISSPFYSNIGSTVQSTQSTIVSKVFDFERLFKNLHFSSSIVTSSDYLYEGDKVNGNYTEIISYYSSYVSLHVNEVSKKITEDPKYISELEVLDKLITKDLTFSNSFSFYKVLTTYEDFLVTGQVLEDFSSELYYLGNARLVQKVPEPPTIILLMGAIGWLSIKLRKIKL